jgi:hypothetical protein
MQLMIQANDACFDKLKLLYEGEKFVDQSRCVVHAERVLVQYTLHALGMLWSSYLTL